MSDEQTDPDVASVGGDGAPTTLIPPEIEVHTEGQTEAPVDEGRIEELLQMGLRPEDARRVERLERGLDLPEEPDERDRARCSALLRADLKARKRIIAHVLKQVHNEEITPHMGLRRLQAFEIVDDSLGCARLFVDNRVLKFICYDGRTPHVEFRLRIDGGSHSQPDWKRVTMRRGEWVKNGSGPLPE